METYYQLYKERLLLVCQAFYKTKVGREYQKKDIPSYSAFAQSLPLTEGQLLREKPKDLIANGSFKLKKFSSSGTTGTQKIIYVPENMAPDIVPQNVLDAVSKYKNPLFIGTHSKSPEPEYVYWAYENIYRYHCSRFQAKEFYNMKTAIDIAKGSEFLIIYDYPSGVQRFLFYISQYLDQHPIERSRFKKKVIAIEICGEQIEINSLRQLSKKTSSLFGIEPVIWVSYGLTEVGNVGIYRYDKKDRRILYEVDRNIFLEILDVINHKPIGVKKEGEIILTSLRTQGTIICRYRTRDIGRLIFEKGKKYLKFLKRDPRTTTVFIAGGKFSMLDLRNVIIDKFHILPTIEVKRKVISSKGKETLNIDTYLPTKLDNTSTIKIKEFIVDWVTKEVWIGPGIKEGKFKIIVKIHLDSMGPKKTFRLKA